MSKAISTILTVVSIAALAVVTAGVGLGVAAGLSVGASISGVAAYIGISSSLLIGAALGGLSFLIGGPSAPKPEQTETAIKSPTPTRISGYGRQRLYIAYALYTTARDGTAFDVGAFHDGQIDAIETYYLGDKKVAPNGAGWVPKGSAGEWGSNLVRIGTTLGAATNTAFSYVASALPDQWTTDHRGDGVVTGYVRWGTTKAKDFQEVYPNGGPNASPLSLAMRLQLVFDWRDATQNINNPLTWKWSENACLHLAHYLLIRDSKDWATHFVPTLSYWTAAANDCDSAVPLRGVHAVLLADAKHGVVLISVSTTNGLTIGGQITVSATGNTSLAETRTVTGIAGSTVMLSSTLSNDHPSGSQVSWLGNGASEPRYRSCVVHKHTDAHKDVISNLLGCFDGWLAPRADGALVVYSGRYIAPTVEIGPDEIVSYSLQDGVDEESSVNQITITYISANHDFSAVDTDAWEDTDDIAVRGKVLADTLEVQTPSFSQNRRLAKRKMARVMAPKRGQITTNFLGRKVRGQRFIRVNLTDAGTTFYAGPAEITKLVRNISTGGVTLEWVAADPNVDAWNPATEEGSPAPVGNRVATEPLVAPTIISATADFAAVSDDGTGVRITIVASGLNRADVVWSARWRTVGSASWNEAPYPDLDPGASVTIETGFVPTSATVEVAVAYSTGDGRVSPWSASSSVVTKTDATPPDDATTISVVSWSDTLTLATDRIARASSYRWRIYADNGTSLIRTVVTTTPQVGYTSGQAATDGARRSYIIRVAGVNAAGAGVEASTGTITLAAPAAVTGVSATGGANEGQVSFTLLSASNIAGYLIPVANVASFDPMTQGQIFRNLGASPAYIQGLAAGTFYTKVAAYDAWSDLPALLNFSAEASFAITAGGGGTGGGGGGGGGGYCPEVDTLILLANDAANGPGAQKRAGDLTVGDLVWTQHEETMAWDAYSVEAIEIVSEPVFAADIGIARMRATPGHRVWRGGGWVRFDAIGAPDGEARVARITVTEAHTYVSNGVLSHNIKSGDIP
ncbi:MAG: hypothetical protein P0Y64_16865 [Candidatus Sphingomonas colombiensis]|nr:hypothetical protein [Sphingomonas sp.]WEK42992.1 MAG: hypothetical protein P0Y64_16865 [Sphingomonas sp.]